MIQTLIEKERGCGFRKKGGMYLIGGSSFAGCCKLPFPLTVCPCCGGGIKFSRGFTWINSKLFALTEAMEPYNYACYNNCVFAQPDTKMGLMWVGESFYKTPAHFTREADIIGISKRISQIPKECMPGKTWIALAHNKAISSKWDPIDPAKDLIYTPGVFMVFLLQSIQYVVTGKESADELEKIEKRGVVLVDVIPEGEPIKLFE